MKFVDYHNCRHGTHKVFDLITEKNIDIDKLIEAFKEMEDGSINIFATLDKILHEK